MDPSNRGIGGGSRYRRQQIVQFGTLRACCGCGFARGEQRAGSASNIFCRRQPDGYARSDRHTGADGDTGAIAGGYAHSYGYAGADTGAIADGYARSNGYAGAYGDAVADAYPRSHSHAGAHAHGLSEPGADAAARRSAQRFGAGGQ